jgi:dTDP-4-dehydrorhamnose 3,5-epimerase
MLRPTPVEGVLDDGRVPIEGVRVIPLQSFPDERGTVLRMLKLTDPYFIKFGEVYFSTVYPGIVKAWKRHHRATVNYACVSGLLKLVLYDDRPQSSTTGTVIEVVLGPDSYSLVVVPPGVWNGFQGLSQPLAILANCSTEQHDTSEFDRVDPQSDTIPYTW